MTTVNDKITWFIFRQVINHIKFSDHLELLPTIYHRESIDRKNSHLKADYSGEQEQCLTARF